MQPRINYRSIAPGVLEQLMNVEKYISTTGLEHELLTLVKVRASQINGCVWCLDMHTKDAKSAGEDEQKLILLPAWREALVYTDRERAALEWTERITQISDINYKISDDIYDSVKQQFTDKELVDLTMAVVAINNWNRFNIAFKNVVCDYQPKKA